MKPHFFGWALLVATAVFMAGCSDGSPAAAKVDIKAQLAALKSEDANARMEACVQLGEAGPKAVAAVPDLIEMLKDPNSEIRRLSAYALCMIGPEAKAAIPNLKELTGDPDQRVMMQAVNALNAIDVTGEKVKLEATTQ